MRPILLRGHEKPITTVKFNFDGDLLFTGSGEKKINLWYSISGERIGSFEPKAAVRTLDISNDSEILIVGTNVGTLEFFKVNGGQLLGYISMDARLKSVQLSYGDKKLIVLAEWYSRDEKAGTTEFLIYNFEEVLSALKKKGTPDEQLAIKPESVFSFPNKYCQVAWGPLNETILAGREDGTFEIVDLNGKVVKSVQLFETRLNSFSISKEFAFMVACSKEGAKLVDPETLEVIKTVKTEVPMNAGCVSPFTFNSKKPKYHAIIAGGVPAIEAAEHKLGGFEVRLINLVTEEEIGRIAGHFGPVNTLNFYPDGRGFVSGGEEGIVRLFRFPEKYFSDFE